MKQYLSTIKYAQEFLLGIGILTLATLPLVIVFGTITDTTTQTLFAISHTLLLFIMVIRPLADIFITTRWIRPLVILRKGTGVVSAAIIVSFIIAKLITGPTLYFASIATSTYWSLSNYALLAHVADLSAVLLLITSNNFSKRVLGVWWKRIQKLAYVYFYASALYVVLSYGSVHQFIAIILVTILTYIAFIKNKQRRAQTL